ncbi:MAG: CotH kinase family protein [Christensenellaceae bacterium]|nr:CotH kinase family protein [Christensenellaceae bacterium]
MVGEQTLPPGEYLRVDLAGKENSDERLASFKLKAAGEGLYFFDPNGDLVDRLLIPPLSAGLSYGRGADGALFYYKQPTLGAPNAEGYAGALLPVRFSRPGGVGIGPFELELSAEDGAAIHYSLDGSEPSASSASYSGPIQINKNTVLRAIAIRPGALDSPIATQSYLPEAAHSVRVVSLVTEPANLFSDAKGIYADGPNYQPEFPHGYKNHGANFWMDWERPVNVEIFEPGGEILLSQDGSFKINGQYSRAQPQKSFAVYAREEYGENRFNASLFSDRDYTSYKSFVLRSTAQDSNRARMRDVICTDAMLGQGVLYQESEVCVVYINGEYWGHYNMRERINKWSVAQWEGIEDKAVIDQIDLLKGNGKSANQTLNGSNEEYRALIDYVRANDLTQSEHLNYVLDRVDVQNYFDYLIAEIFWANSDTGNIKFYKVPGGKWKWILYDLDWSMNNSESMPVSWNTFAYVLHLHDHLGTGVGHSFETVLSYKLLENQEMKELFLQRLAYFMKNVYTSERLVKLIEEQEETMLPEMERHFARWPADGSVSSWQRSVTRIKEWVQKRPASMLENCQSYFDLSDAKMKELFGELEGDS